MFLPAEDGTGKSYAEKQLEKIFQSLYSYCRTKMGSDQFTSTPFQIVVKLGRMKYKFHQFTFLQLLNNLISIVFISSMPYISKISIYLLSSSRILEIILYRALNFLKTAVNFGPEMFLYVFYMFLLFVHAQGHTLTFELNGLGWTGP